MGQDLGEKELKQASPLLITPVISWSACLIESVVSNIFCFLLFVCFWDGIFSPDALNRGTGFLRAISLTYLVKMLKMYAIKGLGGIDGWLFQILQFGELKYIPWWEVPHCTWNAWTIEGNSCTEKPICQRSCTLWVSDPRWAKIMSMIMCVLVSSSKPFECSNIGKPCQHSVQIPDGGLLPVPTVLQFTTGIALISKLNTYLLNCHLQKFHVISQTIMISVSLTMSEHKLESQISPYKFPEVKQKAVEVKGVGSLVESCL